VGWKAPTGFEPVHKGFADLSLTTWVRRRYRYQNIANTAVRVQGRATRRLFALVAAVAFLCGATFPVAAELIVGGRLVPEFTSWIDLTHPIASATEASLSAASSIHYRQGEFEALAIVRLSGPVPESPTAAIDEAWIAYAPLDWLALRAGRFAYSPSVALALPSVDFFGASDYAAILPGVDPLGSEDPLLLQAQVFWQSFYAHLIVAPLRPSMVLIPTDSPWFPTHALPTGIVVSFPDEHRIERGEVRYVHDEPARTVADVGGSLVLGAYLGGVELSLMGFHGYRRDSLLKGEIVLEDLVTPFAVELTPEYAAANALGLAAATTWADAHFWADGAWYPSRRLASKRLGVARFETTFIDAPQLEGTAGASYDIYPANLSLALEARDSIVLTDDSDLERPAFASLAVAVLSFQPLDGLLEVRATGALSLTDSSAALETGLWWRPIQELSLALRAVNFNGKERSEFGQFEDLHPLMFSVSAGF
jgi:hypothetical protein